MPILPQLILMPMLIMLKLMLMAMRIMLLGSEAMIGYSPAVLATDLGTERQPTALKGALIALDTSKYSQFSEYSQHQNTHNINPETCFYRTQVSWSDLCVRM